MSPHLSRRALVVGVLLPAAVVLPLATGSLSLAANGRAATPAAATPPSKGLGVRATTIDALSPGATRSGTVTVVNEHSGDVRLVSLVGAVEVRGAGALSPACDPRDVEVVTDVAAAAPSALLTRRGGSATVPVTVTMRPSAQEQDGCRGQSFRIVYTATGQGK